jgi:transcriptional regulator with XRE-family HTH domain
MTNSSEPHASISQFSIRLKAARKAAGLTQEQLGYAVGLDEFVASARMNHYEKGRHWPNYDLVCKIAAAVNVPAAYFYTKEDEFADFLKIFWRAGAAVRAQALIYAEAGGKNPTNDEVRVSGKK